MVAAVQVHKTGGPEVLTLRGRRGRRAGPGPGPHQAARLRHQLHRHLFPHRSLSVAGRMPFIAGNEAAGEVTAVGPGRDRLQGRRPRQLCRYRSAAMRPNDAPADRAGQAAGRHLLGAGRRHDAQGHDGALSASRTYKVSKGTTVLIHAAAGGVGLIACQWANASRRHRHRHRRLEGKGRARQGQRRHHVINYRNEDFVARGERNHQRQAVRRGL